MAKVVPLGIRSVFNRWLATHHHQKKGRTIWLGHSGWKRLSRKRFAPHLSNGLKTKISLLRMFASGGLAQAWKVGSPRFSPALGASAGVVLTLNDLKKRQAKFTQQRIRRLQKQPVSYCSAEIFCFGRIGA
jgi:hypothetical protein